MRLEKTRLVLERSQAIVSNAKLEQDVLANYLTAHILIIFHSEIEEKIKEIVYLFLKEASNENISYFLRGVLDTIIKRIKKDELEKTLSYFGLCKKTTFSAAIDNVQITKYITFITNRHNAAHGKSIEVSWSDVQEIVDIGEAVLSAFSTALKT